MESHSRCFKWKNVRSFAGFLKKIKSYKNIRIFYQRLVYTNGMENSENFAKCYNICLYMNRWIRGEKKDEVVLEEFGASTVFLAVKKGIRKATLQSNRIFLKWNNNRARTKNLIKGSNFKCVLTSFIHMEFPKS